MLFVILEEFVPFKKKGQPLVSIKTWSIAQLEAESSQMLLANWLMMQLLMVVLNWLEYTPYVPWLLFPVILNPLQSSVTFGAPMAKQEDPPSGMD